MITEITSEATTWLGYLQRGSVLIQVGLFVAAISSESRVKRKLSSPLIASLTHLIVPAALLISASVLTLAGITAGFLQLSAVPGAALGAVALRGTHQAADPQPLPQSARGSNRPIVLPACAAGDVDPHLCPDAGQPGIVGPDFHW